jgi:TetR/AcrR family transcriptional regulator, cholesterol catabolism regulator
MRNRILKSAARLFRTKGYRATTMRSISEVVGILSGSIFHHFASKEQILVEIMHDAAKSMCERADDIANGAQMPADKLRGLIALQLDCLLGEAKRDFYAVLISEWRELNSPSKVPLTAMRQRYFAAWQRVLDDCAQSGLLRADAHATLFALHGAINWANTWLKPSGKLQLDDYRLVLERLALSDRAFGTPVEQLGETGQRYRASSSLAI